MRILVIGGTYFLGKAFVELACKEHELTLLNRGSRQVSFAHPEHIQNITMDRHQLRPELFTEYDAVVDFCAYEKGDIREILHNLSGKVTQYIFVSTCDVYQRGTGKALDETAPLETRDFGGAAGAYILGKAALEQELADCSAEFPIHYTAVRPPFIYGPGNYAKREDLFFHWIEQAGQVLYPADADGTFQMLYVRDAAAFLLKACGNPSLYNKGINLCPPEKVTYDSFCTALEKATGTAFARTEISTAEVLERQIPLPFPLTAAESEYYISRYEDLLPVSYTPLAEGLRETYLIWKEHTT